MERLTKWYIEAKRLINNEEGVGTIELILILFVLVGLVIMFRTELMKIAKSYLNKMDPKFKH